MKRSSIALIAIAATILTGLAIVVVKSNDRPLGSMVASSGYPAESLFATNEITVSIEPRATVRPRVDLQDKRLRELVYVTQYNCVYTFLKDGPTPFSRASWIFVLMERDRPTFLGNNARYRPGTDMERLGFVDIAEPAPRQLWDFVNKYVEGVSPLCNPAA